MRAPDRSSAYGVDKHACELHAGVAAKLQEVPTIGLRFFNVYGPRQSADDAYAGVISVFTDRLRRGQEILLQGGGRQERDFVFVADVVNALRAAMGVLEHSGPAGGVVDALAPAAAYRSVSLPQF